MCHSFFNGIAAHDAFLHGVFCEAMRRELLALGFRRVEFVPIDVEKPMPHIWEGTSLQHWWHFDQYQMPACYW